MFLRFAEGFCREGVIVFVEGELTAGQPRVAQLQVGLACRQEEPFQHRFGIGAQEQGHASERDQVRGVAIGPHPGGRQPVDFAAARGFQVVSGATGDVVLINTDGRQVKCGPIAAACEFAWGRFENDAFARGFIIRGHRFETSDGFAFRAAAPVDHCSLRRTPDRLVGSINGGAFDIGVGEHVRKGLINGAAFEVSQPASLLAGAESSWNLVNNANEAIN